MTKRFTYMEQFNGFCDVYDNGKILSCMRLEYVDKTVELLNEQHEENIELKHDNKRLVKFIMSKGYTLKDYLDWLKKEVWE